MKSFKLLRLYQLILLLQLDIQIEKNDYQILLLTILKYLNYFKTFKCFKFNFHFQINIIKFYCNL